MSQNFIDIFKRSCIKLAHTVVINHPHVGVVINRRLEQEGYGSYTNIHDRKTWKYYLNMAGLYHAYDSAEIYKINKLNGLGETAGIDQTKMIIRVAGDNGTLEKEFILANISGSSSDENIALEYQIGETEYISLVNTYPQFESLINGILHPIPLDTSVFSEDYAVLYCGGYYRTRLDVTHSEYAFIKGSGLIYDFINLVEDWEYSLIYKIQDFTKTFFKQHDSNVYAEYNDLYFAASIGIYYLNLPTFIFNTRMDSSRGMEAHSTHVQLYLDSKANIGQYLSYLTRNQYMYLYRNVEWLVCNSGKQKVFDDLVENFLREREVAVIVYDGAHDLSSLGENSEPAPLFIRDYDKGSKLIDTQRNFTPEELLLLEADIARDNPKNINDQIQTTTNNTLNSTSAAFKTKVVETHLTVQILNQYVSREEFLFNNWVWSAINDEYKGIISVSLPGTSDKLQLTIKSAVILFYYCHAKGFLNTTLTSIPELQLHHIPKVGSELPSLAALKGRISDDRFTDEELDKIVTVDPVIYRSYSSTGQFGRKINKQWQTFISRNYVAHANPYIQASAEIKDVVSQLYRVERLNINLPSDYETWIANLGGGVSRLDTEGFRTLSESIFTTALNLEGEDESYLNKVHKAMINIVKTFSSYNIQFITKTAIGEVSNLGVNYLRMEHVSSAYIDNDDYFIYNYPDYISEVQGSFTEDVRWGFFVAFNSIEDPINVTQQQLSDLMLAEQA